MLRLRAVIVVVNSLCSLFAGLGEHVFFDLAAKAFDVSERKLPDQWESLVAIAAHAGRDKPTASTERSAAATGDGERKARTEQAGDAASELRFSPLVLKQHKQPIRLLQLSRKTDSTSSKAPSAG